MSTDFFLFNLSAGALLVLPVVCSVLRYSILVLIHIPIAMCDRPSDFCLEFQPRRGLGCSEVLCIWSASLSLKDEPPPCFYNSPMYA